MSYKVFEFRNETPVKLEDRESEQNFPGANNRVRALKALSQSLLQEIEALWKDAKSEKDLLEELQQGKIDLKKEVKKYEIELICCALLLTGGRQRPAAKLLNIKISTLNSKIKRYGVSTSGLRSSIAQSSQ